ncbi:MAG: hypothetical protein JWL84_494 [Rhodospirillales bacterium]|nr:hypothetical protein [Rhodospirillales bacterium]
MGVTQNLLLRAFGRPQGRIGRLGGIIMARMNDEFGGWVIGLLDVDAADRVLEVGFGPGAAVRRLAAIARSGHVAGVDPSRVMLAQACAGNAGAIRDGRIDLRQGTVECLPFADLSFDKVLSLNSLPAWSDRVAGLCEIRRVLVPGGRIALGFTPRSGQKTDGLPELLTSAGFTRLQLLHSDQGFCALASRP